MLILLFALVMEPVAAILGFRDSRTYLLAMANVYEFLALLTQPLFLVPSLIGPPLVARARNRGFWRWLLAALAVGPFGFVVLLLPRGDVGGHAGSDESLSCPHCAQPYLAADYRPDAESWACTRCGGSLPRAELGRMAPPP